MLLLNLSDGSSRTFDLFSPEGRKDWEDLLGRPNFHASVRGISLSGNGTRTDLPVPRRFLSVRYGAELVLDGEGVPVAERAEVAADGVYLTLTVYPSGRVRVDLDRRGRARFVSS